MQPQRTQMMMFRIRNSEQLADCINRWSGERWRLTSVVPVINSFLFWKRIDCYEVTFQQQRPGDCKSGRCKPFLGRRPPVMPHDDVTLQIVLGPVSDQARHSQ